MVKKYLATIEKLFQCSFVIYSSYIVDLNVVTKKLYIRDCSKGEFSYNRYLEPQNHIKNSIFSS